MNKQARKDYLREHKNLSDWQNQLLSDCRDRMNLRSLELERIGLIVGEMVVYEKLEDKDERAYQIMKSISEKQFILYDELTSEIDSMLRKLEVIRKIFDREFGNWCKVIERI